LLSKSEPHENILRYMQIIHEHEERGAQRSVPMAGAEEFLKFLDNQNIRKAVLTRNSLPVADMTFKKLGWNFEMVVARDCVARAKPFPDGLFHICESMGVLPQECVYIGDYSFDLDTAKGAGMPAILYSPLDNPELENEADLVVRCFEKLTQDFDNEFLRPLKFSPLGP